MKTRKKFNVSIFTLIVVLILSFTAKVNSQVIVKLQYPPPNQVNIDDLWKLQTITNTTQKNYIIYLHGTVTNNDNGDRIWTGNSSSFDLEAGYSGPVEPSTLEPVSGNFNHKYDKAKEIAIRTGSLPAGNYTLCVYVKNADNDQELGKDCIQVNVAHPSPPELISPQDGAVIQDEYPVFTWMPPMPIPPGQEITYVVKIVEILNGQTKEEAMQSNPAWFENKDIQTTSFQYPVSARKFKAGKKYAWQLICFMDPNLAYGLKSEVWSFEYLSSTFGIIKILEPEGDCYNVCCSGDTTDQKITFEIIHIDRVDLSKSGFSLRRTASGHCCGSWNFGAPIHTIISNGWGTYDRDIIPNHDRFTFFPYNVHESCLCDGDNVWYQLRIRNESEEDIGNSPYEGSFIVDLTGPIVTDYSPETDFSSGPFNFEINIDDNPHPICHGNFSGFDGYGLLKVYNQNVSPHQLLATYMSYWYWYNLYGDVLPRVEYNSLNWDDSENKFTANWPPTYWSRDITLPDDTIGLCQLQICLEAWDNCGNLIDRTSSDDGKSCVSAGAPFCWEISRGDYGDAPDEFDNLKYHYCSHNLTSRYDHLPPGYIPETPWSSYDAAKHCDFSKEWLGNINDSCQCSGPSATAETDAKTINLDEFDNGVAFTDINFNTCDTQTVRVLINTSGIVSRYNVGCLHLHAWFDWNRDGDWDDTYECDGTPADDHIYWLTAKPLCMPTGTPPININRYDFKICEPYWINEGRNCEIYELTFLAGDTTKAEGTNEHVSDSLWCRFRLSYDGDGGTEANEYHGGVKFGEVEDYPLVITSPPDTTCQCECDPPFISGPNLVVNSNFSLGNTGFTSGFTYVAVPPSPPPPVNEGKYCITTNAALASPSHWVGFDHTLPPTGNFLACNGYAIPSLATSNWAWRNSMIVVTPSTNYKFCFWVRNLNKTDYTPGSSSFSNPLIQPSINGVPITSFRADYAPVTPHYNVPQDNTWHFIEADWFSGAVTGPINIEIWTMATAYSGNDFGIDDICFFKCDTIPPPPPDTTCQCECDPPFISGHNLVTNGDFSTGTIAPNTSVYAPWPGAWPTMTEGKYFVGNNATLLNAWTGTGMGTPPDNFLMCNGSTIAGTPAWKSLPITVNIGSTYKFCVYANNLIPPTRNISDPSIQLRINGVAVSPIILLPEIPNVWVPITGTWIAGVTTANLEILSTSTEKVGNDFGIDCISFIECTPPDTNQCDCEIIKVHINGTSVEDGDRIDISGASVFLPVSRHFDVTANCGDCPLTSYLWTITKPDGSIDTDSSPIFTYSFTHNGLYTFEITITCSDGSTCNRTFSVNIAAGGNTIAPYRPPQR